MSRKDDLEQDIHQSYEIIREYERLIQTSDRPEEKLRARRLIQEQWSLIERQLTEYRVFTGGDRYLPQDIAQIAAYFGESLSRPTQISTNERVMLDLEQIQDIASIRRVYRRMSDIETDALAGQFLREFRQISRSVDTALNQRDAYSQRLSLGEVQKRLPTLLQALLQSKEDYTDRLRMICSIWQEIIADQIRELSHDADKQSRISSPYIVGVPLTVQQEIFVGRVEIAIQLEQLLLNRHCPPLLLYGQRRMGKTSLLRNLRRLLPSAIVPLFVDLQSASTASDHAGFLYNVVRQMTESARSERNLTLPVLTREMLEPDPFVFFGEWLSEVEAALKSHTALLMLDEFETLDQALSQGKFSETDVLGMLRHLIQHRPRFKVLLAGSHTLEELQRWASYLINVRVVYVGYLKEAEARQLVEQPVKDFPLRYEPAASQRVLDLTRGHPCLVQMLCNEIVAIKNEQEPSDRFLASMDDVEKAVHEAFKSSSFFFADIQRNQVDDEGLAVLRFLAAQGEAAIVKSSALARRFSDTLNHTLEQLIQRELIEKIDDGYRFQVEMIRRWFAQ